ncbi:MAG: LAGLIDADG family homing endonuclease, partial [Cycloclasticus sp.]|nr:LAGLIDADG family homing endonuclease [Cycloclasticus sp.]
MTTAKLKVVKEQVPNIEFQSASMDIWDKKYCLKKQDGSPVDNSIQDTYDRVATAISEVEETAEKQAYWHDQFVWALKHGAIPAGRIISNAGASAYKPATSTINCTVSGSIRDSMDDILGKTHEAGLTLKAGCGIGYEFSTLRPKGAYVSGAGANTSGPLSFMDIFDKMCFTVSSAGGRRGAQMATFDVAHPDARDFVRVKREDGRLRQFNLSLLITDDFVQAVKDDADWPLVFPILAKEMDASELDLNDTDKVLWREWPITDGYIVNDVGLVACRIYKVIKAQRMWETIMASTYDYAEPGFILIDKVNEMNNNWFCENIRATNPCVTADTWVQTSTGPQQVQDLIGVPFVAQVDGKGHASGDEGFFKTATKPVVRLQTTEGHKLRLTADHRVRRVNQFTRYTTDTEWCEAGQLQPGDRVLLNDHRTAVEWKGEEANDYNHGQGYLMGLLVGDGTLKSDKAVLSVWKQPAMVNGVDAHISTGVQAVMAEALEAAQSMPHRSDFKGWQEIAGRNEYRLATASVKQLAEELGMQVGDKQITAKMERASSDFNRGFLRGFFDADGSVQGDQQKGVSVRLSQSDLPRLETAQRILLRLGVASQIYKNRRQASLRMLPDGKGGQREYETKAQHELVISGENLIQFQSVIGFGDTDKANRLEQALSAYKRKLNRERFVARVETITDDGIEDVYDVQVPGINTFDANGLHAHNCGEQPLPPYGSCLLGSVNLTKFVINPFTDGAEFDWEKFRKTVGIFTRMLDNVVEINGLPLEGQREAILNKRRHGMGYLGLGSTLTLMGMEYGSDASLELTERVTRALAMVGWETGVQLAEEKGPAPILIEDFTVTAEMLRKRPEMKTDGYKIGDSVKGKILHARYSRYMQKVAGVNPELVAAMEEKGCRFTHHSSIAPTGT